MNNSAFSFHHSALAVEEENPTLYRTHMTNLQEDIRQYLAPKKALIKRRARGMLKYDYLVPGGVYEEQWDWDAFFIGMALAAEIPTEAVFLRNWALNYIENSAPDGFTPGLVTPDGPDKRLNHMKPLLAQGSYHASKFLKDFSWLAEGDRYEKLKKIVLYREQNGFWDATRGLGAWTNSMESGADNNVALLEYPDKSVAAVDCSCFIYGEYKAMSMLATELSHGDDAKHFTENAEKLKTAILTHMWNAEAGMFENIDLRDGSAISVATYSSIHPFFYGIANKDQAKIYIEKYVLNAEKLRSAHGIRTLSKDHPQYNNANILKPHSNWQGPIWPISTYIHCQAITRYGYAKEAMEVATQQIGLCIADIQKTGGMHENYDAETGEPLAAPNFVSWNLLMIDLLRQLEAKENPFGL